MGFDIFLLLWLKDLSDEDREIIGFLYWLVVMFDMVFVLMNEWLVVFFDEECEYDVVEDDYYRGDVGE